MNLPEPRDNVGIEPLGRSLPVVLHPRVVTGAGGGPDKTILNSPRFLRQLGYDSACLYLRPPKDAGFEALRERAEKWDAPLEEIDDRGVTDWKIIPQALEVCRRRNVRIWHGHDYKTNLLGLLLRRWHPMKLVTTVHGWVHHTAKTPLYYQLDRWAIKRYDRVVCVSPDLLDACRKSGVASERLLLIENAIDTEQFRRQRDADEAKRSLGLPIERPLIGAVGRLSPEKGFDQLIKAIAELRTLGRDPLLAILGDGDQRPALQALIDKLELQQSVRLVGFQKHPFDWYEAMDMFVLSSLREGLPNVVLEAMAIETPVVATRVAGVPRLIDDGVSGLIVPVSDHDALVSAMSSLLGDELRRRELALNARRVIEDRYSFAARMQKIVDVYQQVGISPGYCH